MFPFRAIAAKNDEPKEEKESYFAGFNRYTGMAYILAKMLNMRPNDILDNWCAPELIVAYGQYANEIADKNYQEWKSLPGKSRAKIKKPDKFVVQFIGLDKLDVS